MIEVITETDEITGKILKIIKGTKTGDNLFIVSPYLQGWARLTDALNYVLKQGVKIILITREEEGKSASKIEPPFDQCEIWLLTNLHSKIYYNCNEALITSMNIYKHSTENNHEIGVFFSDDEEKQLSIINKNIDFLIAQAEPSIPPEKVEKEEDSKAGLNKIEFQVISRGWKWTKIKTTEGYENKLLNQNAPPLVKGKTYEAYVKKVWNWTPYGMNVELIEMQDLKSLNEDYYGYCIFCKNDIEFNTEKPICKPCYYKKKKDGGNFIGLRCHKCGESNIEIEFTNQK